MHLNILEKVILTDNVLESYYGMVSKLSSHGISKEDFNAYLKDFLSDSNIDSLKKLVPTFFQDVGMYDDTDIQDVRSEGHSEEDVIAMAMDLWLRRKVGIAEKNITILLYEIVNKIPSGIEWNASSQALKKLYELLVLNEYLDTCTKFDVFDKAFHNYKQKSRINWKGSITSLAYFIDQLYVKKIIKSRRGHPIHKEDVSTFLCEGDYINSTTLRKAKNGRKYNRETSSINRLLSTIQTLGTVELVAKLR